MNFQGFKESDVENTLMDLISNKNYSMINDDDKWLQNRKLDDFINESVLLNSIKKINPNIREELLKEVIKKVKLIDEPSLFVRNRIFHDYLINGISVEDLKNDISPLIYLIDFKDASNNTYEIAHQIKFQEFKDRSTRIPDIILYINGLPLIVMELKAFNEDNSEATLNHAYKQLGSNSESDGYRYDIPTLFNYNAFLVISDGANVKVGTLTSKIDRYNEWKSVNGESGYDDLYPYKLNVFVDGLLEPTRLLDIIKYHLFFIQSKNQKPIKIMAQYFQYFGVIRSIDSVKTSLKPDGDGKAGIVWHTQGSGKSFSMVMLAHRLMLEKSLNVPTIVILTDRIDLDEQIYATFHSAREYLRVEPVFANSRKDLIEKLSTVQQGGIILSTVGKFDKENVVPNLRSNIVVMADEAHRGHYGIYESIRYVKNNETDGYDLIAKYGVEKYIRETLPNATFIGFTGTPITSKEKSTVDIYGDIIDTYDMTQSVIDGSTVRIYYEARLAKIWTNQAVLEEIDSYYQKLQDDETASFEAVDKSKKEMSKLKIILEDDNVLKNLAKDIVNHYEDRKNFLHGKVMIVVSTRFSAFKLYNYILDIKPEYKDILLAVVTESNKDTKEMRTLFKNSTVRSELAEEFKKEDSKYKIAIVVDMWLTGFDVPDLDVMYFFKRLKSHALMQAIARVNRVYPGKENGLIVDYIGLNRLLEEALEEYTARDRDFNIQDIQKEALKLLKEKLSILNEWFTKVDKAGFYSSDSFKRFTAIQKGAEFILSDTNEDPKKNRENVFLQDLSLIVKQAFVLCAGICSPEEREDIFYYLAVRSFILKLKSGSSKISIGDINAHVRELLADALQSDEVKVLTKTNKEANVIDLLRPEKIEELRKLNPPHVFVQIIKKLLERAIAESRKNNLFKSQEYSKRLMKILEQYHERDASFDTQITIIEMINFAQDVVNDEDDANKHGLFGRERAFYDALIRDKSAQELMNDETLKLIAHELRATVEEYAKTDWTKKKSTRAQMRVQIKELLKKYNYPPDFEKQAIEDVMNQAEYMLSE